MDIIREVNDPAEIANLEGMWRELLDETPGASFFLSPGWLTAYWRHSGAGQKLRLLIVGCGDRPEGLLPLTVKREKTKVGRLRMLGYPLDAWGSFYGPIGRSPRAILMAGLRHVARSRRDWDFIELRGLGAPGTVPAEMGQAMQRAGFRPIPSVFDRTSIFDFHGTWEQHLARQPRRWRRNLRADGHKLQQLGQVEFIRYRPAGRARGDDDPRWDLYRACEQVARRSWQGVSDTGTTLSHSSVSPLLRDLHEVAAAEAAVDLNLLLIDGEPAAFVYNYHHRGCLYGLRLGYDPKHGRAGAGGVLLSQVIRDSYARGDRLFDLGVGQHDWKRHFASRVLPILRFNHCPAPVLRAQLLRWKRWVDSRRLAQHELLGCGLDEVPAEVAFPV